MKTFTAALIFVMMVFIGGRMAGQNLVPNYSFEQIDSCPSGVSQFNLAEPWFIPTLGTTDLYSHCNGVLPIVDVPSNWTGYQNARTGISYAGFYFWFNWGADTLYREYLEAPLGIPLEGGTKYYVSFFLSLSDSCGYTTDRIGAYFSSDSLLLNNWNAFLVVPQVENATGDYIIDTSAWIQVKGSFIASGGERFVTIGNFHDDHNTDTLSTGIPLYWPTHQHAGYFYIDDVCVSADSTECYLPVGIQQPKANLFFQISPNPFTTHLQLHYTLTQPGELMVYDALGRKVKSCTLAANEKTFELSVAVLPAGVYLVVVESGGRVWGEKVVKE